MHTDRNGTRERRGARAWARGVLIGLAAGASVAQAAPPELRADAPELRADAPEADGGYTVRSLWTLGGPEAEDAAQFYERIGGVTFDADAAGRLYVLDGGNYRVQVFAPDGSFLRSFGSEGKGPGEFNLPRLIAVNAKGEAAVFDVGNQRISVFAPDGQLIRDQLVAGAVHELELTDDGLVVCSISNRYELVAYGPDGKTAFAYGQTPAPSEAREVNIETPFQTVATRLQAVGDREFVLGGRAEYRLTRFSGADPALAWSRPFERQPLELPDRGGDGEGEPQVVMVVRRDGGEGGGGSAGGGEAQTWSADQGGGETMHFDMNDIQALMPKHVPDVRGVLVWPDARVWAITAENDGDRMVVDEWGLDGRYLRRFAMPRYAWLAVGEDGALYGLTHDDEDYPLVHRLEVATR